MLREVAAAFEEELAVIEAEEILACSIQKQVGPAGPPPGGFEIRRPRGTRGHQACCKAVVLLLSTPPLLSPV